MNKFTIKRLIANIRKNFNHLLYVDFKISTIFVAYSAYVKSRKSIGWELERNYNMNLQKDRYEFLVELLEDIALYNQLIDVFDYTKSEKQKVLKGINKYMNSTDMIKSMFIKSVFEYCENYFEENKFEIFVDKSDDLHLFESEKQFKKLMKQYIKN